MSTSDFNFTKILLAGTQTGLVGKVGSLETVSNRKGMRYLREEQVVKEWRGVLKHRVVGHGDNAGSFVG